MSVIHFNSKGRGRGGRAGLRRVPEGALAEAMVEQPAGALNKEVKRRTQVVGIFPDEAAVIRLVGAVLNEQHDEWQVGKRYFGAGSLAKLERREREEQAADQQPALVES